jgi:hypothetical protein
MNGRRGCGRIVPVLPSAVEGSRGSYLKGFAAGSLDCARDDEVAARGDHKGLLDPPFERVSPTELKIYLDVALMLFGRAGGVERNAGRFIARMHHSVLEQILLDFFATDIG